MRSAQALRRAYQWRRRRLALPGALAFVPGARREPRLNDTGTPVTRPVPDAKINPELREL